MRGSDKYRDLINKIINMKIEFEKRRKQIMKMVGSNAAIIIPCAMPCTRSRDVDYLFRQDSDFYYLSGFEEPNSLIVLIPERAEGEFILFCKNKIQNN